MRYDWKHYLSFGHKLILSEGSTVYNQGQDGIGLYYIEEGMVSIHVLSEEGKERIVNYLLDGYLLGEIGVTGEPHSTTAVCETDTVLYYFSIEAFKWICVKHPKAQEIFMRSLSWKIRSLADIVALTDKPHETQMAHFLLQLYYQYDGLPFPISLASLAKYIGTSRITVYKIVKKWSNKGLISQKNKRIEILDVKGMGALL
ncbi:Crp/Fnr family transcriptional regulator [Siminovitchia sediminis]|uniref:Crp/Fnr family transcriptional regulator n=1 Tax=Siminovitchia sediminis TaxID=1274353 RepID=A0ABW4KIU0_9BACI